jgi:hypothetical protein
MSSWALRACSSDRPTVPTLGLLKIAPKYIATVFGRHLLAGAFARHGGQADPAAGDT